MIRSIKFFLIAYILTGIHSFTVIGQQKSFEHEQMLMGTNFEISIVLDKDEEDHARQMIDSAISEIVRIEKLISSWDTASQTSIINANAGIRPVKVDRELYEIIRRSVRISDLTAGAFDISFAAMDRIWKFDGSMKSWPSEKEIAASVSLVNYKDIILDDPPGTVYLKEKGMKIGFGAIGKGYAANMAMKVLKRNGIENGVVNASGDLFTWGRQPDGSKWKVGILNPENKNEIMAWLPASDMAVVTSGDYEKYIMRDGKRYAHIIDPRTGYPVTGIKSVTVICPNAELADALATSVFVMGIDVGLNLINQLKGIECLVIDDEGVLHHSKNLFLNKNQANNVEYYIGH